MNIRRLTVELFTSHTAATFEFPEAGVVLVTGANGSGKSSIPDAVSMAFWNKTLRGTKPWRRASDAGLVEAEADNLKVTRRRKSGRVTLSWNVEGTAPSVFETPTKAQEALEDAVGSWAVWARCAVFSADDISGFTLATDGERKKLLEAILGLERFDGALKACRKSLEVAERTRRDQEVLVGRLRQALDSQERRLAEALQGLQATPERPAAEGPKATPEKLSEFGRQIQALETELAVIRKALRDTDRAGAEQDAKAAELERRVRALKGDQCPACDQKIPAALRQRLERSVQEARELAEQARAAARAEVSAAESQAEELEDTRRGLVNRRVDLATALKAQQVGAGARDHHQKVADSAKAEVERLGADLKAAEETLAVAQKEAQELTAVETVLGLRGVRAQILSRALGSFETLANSWLTRLTGEDLRVRLRPYTENKTGGVQDSISLEIEGAGEGEGYRGCSRGERRRIDVALLFALAELANAAHGRHPGTLFLDEVFDGLDSSGFDAVAEALVTLAQDRAVVVISHRADLAARLNPVLHWHITKQETAPHADRAA